MTSVHSPSLEVMILDQKHSSFKDPDAASDTDALGILIARHLEYDGLAILEVALAALEDANFKDEADGVARLLDRARKDYA